MKQAKCKVEDCHRPALADPQAQGYCILHAPWQVKDLDEFQRAVDEIVGQAPQNGNICDFSHCYFPRNYDCKNLREALKFGCFFGKAKFYGDANFWGAEFSRRADFKGANFYCHATFEGARFSNDADFKGAEFLDDAAFRGANFSRHAVFMGAKFSGNAEFEEAKFSGYADFMVADFSGDVDFKGAKFSDYAVFKRAEFSGHVDFEGAEFSSDADFTGAEFSQSADFSHVQTAETAKVLFHDVSLSKPHRIKFHHVDLSRWSFLDTDLRRIDFDDVTWAQTRRFLSRRTVLFDELNIANETNNNKEALAKVERLYRHLKQNYESQRDYGRAGGFYYGEMEMKRRQLSPLGQFPFWLYRLMSGYGESYGRALLVLVGMWIFFAVLFTFIGYTDEWGAVQRHWTWNPSAWRETLADIGRSLIYSAQSMTLFHEPDITFHSLGSKAIELIASVLGVIQIALFGLALQRRFKR